MFLGEPTRFADGKAVASYVGLIPCEHSGGGRQRCGALSKQGNALLRFLWGEAATHAVRQDPALKRFYQHKLVQKGLGKGKGRRGSQTRDSALDHVARPDRLPRVLPPRTTAAARWRPCGDAWFQQWSCSAVTGRLIGLPASPVAGEAA